jgi:hypothetical protein
VNELMEVELEKWVWYNLGVLSNYFYSRKNILTYCGITIKKILLPLLARREFQTPTTHNHR